MSQPRLVADERVTPNLEYCLFCVFHEGREPAPRLDTLAPVAFVSLQLRQCPVCRRVYLVALDELSPPVVASSVEGGPK